MNHPDLGDLGAVDEGTKEELKSGKEVENVESAKLGKHFFSASTYPHCIDFLNEHCFFVCVLNYFMHICFTDKNFNH